MVTIKLELNENQLKQLESLHWEDLEIKVNENLVIVIAENKETWDKKQEYLNS